MKLKLVVIGVNRYFCITCNSNELLGFIEKSVVV